MKKSCNFFKTNTFSFYAVSKLQSPLIFLKYLLFAHTIILKDKSFQGLLPLKKGVFTNKASNKK